jgi:hypothetical protein
MGVKMGIDPTYLIGDTVELLAEYLSCEPKEILECMEGVLMSEEDILNILDYINA